MVRAGPPQSHTDQQAEELPLGTLFIRPDLQYTHVLNHGLVPEWAEGGRSWPIRQRSTPVRLTESYVFVCFLLVPMGMKVFPEGFTDGDEDSDRGAHRWG